MFSFILTKYSKCIAGLYVKCMFKFIKDNKFTNMILPLYTLFSGITGLTALHLHNL